jgi:hypothetical protein
VGLGADHDPFRGVFPGHKITGPQDCNTVHTAKPGRTEQNRVWISLLQIFIFLKCYKAIAVLLGAWRLGERVVVVLVVRFPEQTLRTFYNLHRMNAYAYASCMGYCIGSTPMCNCAACSPMQNHMHACVLDYSYCIFCMWLGSGSTEIGVHKFTGLNFCALYILKNKVLLHKALSQTFGI